MIRYGFKRPHRAYQANLPALCVVVVHEKHRVGVHDMTQHVQIRSTTLAAAARRRAAASYAAEHVEDSLADELLARAYRLRRKKSARRVSAARTAALLR
jgi:hypothetical protein